MKMAPYFETQYNTLRDDLLETIEKYVDKSGGGIDFDKDHEVYLRRVGANCDPEMIHGVSDTAHVHVGPVAEGDSKWEEGLDELHTNTLIDIVKAIEEQKGYQL